MNDKELAERTKAILKTRKQDENKTIKTSETPQEMTPLERAMALRRKTNNKYDNYVASKLLPGLDK